MDGREDEMTEPRFSTLSPEAWTPEQRRVAVALAASPRGGVRGPYAPLIHSPELADRMRHLGDFIRFEGVLPPRLKEILIFTVAGRWSAAFMYAVHREGAASHGLAPALVEALARGETPAGLSAAEAAAHAVATELLRNAAVSDATFAAARRHFDERALIELVAFVGYYTSLAMILNTARVEPPAGAAPLPARS
jgi:4-carboxymuconolactone decarboxylase